MAEEKESFPADYFAQIVKTWSIPSLEQTKNTEDEEKSYMKRLNYLNTACFWYMAARQILESDAV